MVKWNTPSKGSGHSGVRLVGGQFQYDPLPLSERVSQRLRDPLKGVSTQDRAEYQARYRQQLRQQEIDLVDKLIEQGAQFDPEELAKKRPGEILEALAPGQGAVIGSRKYNSQELAGMQEKFGTQLKNRALRTQIESLGGTAPEEHKSPSGIMRALDIVSRPGYAVAEMYDRSKESQNDKKEGLGAQLVAGIQGFGAGLAGKEKTTFHENLKEHGAPFVNKPMKEGKATGVLGFALDVGLDPTTYMTLGTGTAIKQGFKKAAEEGAEHLVEGAAKRAGREVVEEGVEDLVQEGGERVMKRTMMEAANSEAVLGGKGARTVRRTIREQAISDAKAFAKEEGKRVSAKQAKEIGEQALKEAEDAAVKRVAQTSAQAKRLTEALASKKEVQLKVLGKRVAGSEKLYRPLRLVADVGHGSHIGGVLNRAFRTDAEVGGAVRALERQYSNVNAAVYEDELRAIQKSFSGSRKAERKAVTHAIESGDTTAIQHSEKLMGMHDKAKEWFGRIADREVEAGALKPEEILDNYVYHVYNKRAMRRIGGAVPSRTGKFSSIKVAKEAGALPVEDIADILAYRLAKSHRISAQYNLYREVANRFGLHIGSEKIRDKALRRLVDDGVLMPGHQVSNIMPKGVHFDVEVADALKKLDKMVVKEESVRDFVKGFDKIQAKFKFGMTAPNPGFHIRNLMGDYVANMLDGVVDPRVYNQAWNIMRDKNLKSTLRIGKHSVSAEDIKILYEGQGLKSGFFHADTGLIPSPGRKIVAAASNATRSASEFREDWMRMAHFVDALKKEGGTRMGAKESLESLSEKAAARVKKFNFDYQDLTPLEKTVFRRAVPFYTFMRKNIPLQLEMLFTRPGRVAVVPKGIRAIQELVGEPQDENPFPGLPDVVPDWIRELPTAQMQAGSEAQPSVFLQPDLPIGQLQDYFGGFVTDQGDFSPSQGIREGGQELAGAFSPVGTIPLEYFMQRDLQSGAPQNMSFRETLLNQLPAYGTVRAVQDPDEGQAQQQIDVGGHTVSERLLNYLTGAGVRVNTPQRQKSQLKRDEDVLRAILAKLEEEMLAKQGG